MGPRCFARRDSTSLSTGAMIRPHTRLQFHKYDGGGLGGERVEGRRAKTARTWEDWLDAPLSSISPVQSPSGVPDAADDEA
jgi:hypothetical protein